MPDAVEPLFIFAEAVASVARHATPERLGVVIVTAAESRAGVGAGDGP